MYYYPSILIVGILFIALALAMETCYRLGRRSEASTGESTKSQVNAVQAALLALLAMLLGFTFSLSLSRHDTRSLAVVDEANAIGTAYLRSNLLPASVRNDTQEVLRQYLDLRVQAVSISFAERDNLKELHALSDQKMEEAWEHALTAAKEVPGPIVSLFINALNEQIDSFGRRVAALRKHVPEPVILLLLLTFVMTAGVVGYASGLSGSRAAFATYIQISLITLLVFIVIDLDRPRRGLIAVSQKNLFEVHETISSSKAPEHHLTGS